MIRRLNLARQYCCFTFQSTEVWQTGLKATTSAYSNPCFFLPTRRWSCTHRMDLLQELPGPTQRWHRLTDIQGSACITSRWFLSSTCPTGWHYSGMSCRNSWYVMYATKLQIATLLQIMMLVLILNKCIGPLKAGKLQ